MPDHPTTPIRETVERVQTYLDNAPDSGPWPLDADLRALCAHLTALQAENARLREDAARLDWLERIARQDDSVMLGWSRADSDYNEFSGESYNWPASFWAITEENAREHATLREAIDAARTPTD